MRDQLEVPVSLYRGGTSRGILFLEKDVPPPGPRRDRFLLRILGKPDPVELDGLGGGRVPTSKVAIVSRSDEPGADVDYTFAQVEIDQDVVDYTSNCGNISACVAPFAIDRGLVEAPDGPRTVVIFNTNTRKRLYVEVQVAGGRARVLGDHRIAGVPGTGAPIFLDFRETVGANTGRLLPTGNLVDRITMEGGDEVDISIVDVSIVVGHIRAEALGLRGTESAADIQGDPEAMRQINELRARTAQLVGLVDDWRRFRSSSFLPFVSVVAPSADYVASDGRTIGGDAVSFLARLSTLDICHPAYSGTAACATAACAALEGTVLHGLSIPLEGGVVVGHPGGGMPVKVEASNLDDPSRVEFRKIAYSRTARRLLDGVAYLPVNYFEDEGPPFATLGEEHHALDLHGG